MLQCHISKLFSSSDRTIFEQAIVGIYTLSGKYVILNPVLVVAIAENADKFNNPGLW
ncbi:MAG: hypothetical protein HC903_13420 [Methylacidiphilales bacterium]|nr:hypothetical protein [Candidatus Methylacidiphilales bacterium]NJR17019.1 hypothetical protein [Calothrix sp. CSU_2_0]